MATPQSQGPLSIAPVFSSLADRHYTSGSGDYLDAGHHAGLALEGGTISLSFSLDRLAGNMALISKDANGRSAGDFTVWSDDGVLVVAMETDTGTKYAKVPDLVLSAHTTYQFAMSFGSDGLMLWLNGQLVAAEPEFTTDIALNDHPLVVGATRSGRNNDNDPAHSLFKGTIGDVMVFDRQLKEASIRKLAGAVDPMLKKAAIMAADMADLSPLFEQAHHGSDTLKDILEDFGVNEHGHMTEMLTMSKTGVGDQNLVGTAGADGINSGRGDDEINGMGGNDVLQGGYGNDRLLGGGDRDILDGGHGEDRLFGGGGNDLLVSRSDSREPDIAPDPGRDEADPLGELTNGKLYPDQPIHGDDLLVGGSGADIFYFQTLINAKERFIKKHTNDDGSIRWHGVAGENDNLHDHWVDGLGNDVVADYSRAEGDRIVIEGHTTKISSITYGDANGDGVMDHSVISLYSDQGSGGGAHNKDELGTITVYGDLVKMSDIEITAAPAYGIVAGIVDLDEALAPTDPAVNRAPINAPSSGMPNPADLGLPSNLNPVFAIAGDNDFTPEDRAPLVFDHMSSLDLRSGTIALSFTPDSLSSNQSLLSKDASGYGTGGHLSVYINQTGGLTVRLQDDLESHYFEVDHAIKVGQTYDLAVSFGPKGAEVYLNGAKVAYDTKVRVDLDTNTEALIVGASGWSNTPGKTDNIHSHFDGTISDVMVFDKQVSSDEVFGTTARADTEYFNGALQSYSFSKGTAGDVIVKQGGKTETVTTDTEVLEFSNQSVRLYDIQFGSGRSDYVVGWDGADVLLGLGGDDDLHGNGNDDLLRGGNGNDRLYGGDGGDRLYGGADNDKLSGGDGADHLEGGSGDDYLYGQAGNDRFYGGTGDDRFYGHEWGDAGNAGNDRVFFDGDFTDFTFDTETWYDSYRGANVTQLIVTDAASGGSDGYYEGRDKLIDIDVLVFADRSVAFDDLL